MLVEMRVASLTVDPFTNMPIVVLKDHEGRQAVPIWIGLVEASAIATELENIALDRPMTHDLMKTILGQCGVTVDRIEVTDLKENTFYATIHLRRPDGKILPIDARPSDAIALALRYKVPIFVHKDVYESAAIQVKETGAAEERGSEADALLAEALTPTNKDPVEAVKEKLQRALDAEHYEEAARLRDELRRLQSGN